MKTATLSEIKNVLQSLSQKEISTICLRLARYRKENKELLTFLLFEADDEALYCKHVKEEIDHQLRQMSHANIYLAKKTIRKVLNTTNKFIRFSGSKQVEVELLLYFCTQLNNSNLPIHNYPVTSNLFNRQIAKIQKALQSLHEDLQFDYGEELAKLQ